MGSGWAVGRSRCSGRKTNGVVRVYIDRESAAYHARWSGCINYHFTEAEFRVVCSAVGVDAICVTGLVLLAEGTSVENSGPRCASSARVAVLLPVGVAACDQALGKRWQERRGDGMWGGAAWAWEGFFLPC